MKENHSCSLMFKMSHRINVVKYIIKNDDFFNKKYKF